MAEKFQVGDTVFFVRGGWHEAARNNTKPSPCTVLSVGTKWVKLSNGVRCHVDSGWSDSSDGRVGRVWRREEDYRDHVAAVNAWSALRRRVEHGAPPPTATAENIKAAERLLFGDNP